MWPPNGTFPTATEIEWQLSENSLIITFVLFVNVFSSRGSYIVPSTQNLFSSSSSLHEQYFWSKKIFVPNETIVSFFFWSSRYKTLVGFSAFTVLAYYWRITGRRDCLLYWNTRDILGSWNVDILTQAGREHSLHVSKAIDPFLFSFFSFVFFSFLLDQRHLFPSPAPFFLPTPSSWEFLPRENKIPWGVTKGSRPQTAYRTIV